MAPLKCYLGILNLIYHKPTKLKVRSSLPAALLIDQSLRDVALLFGLDHVDLAVELGPTPLDRLGGLLVEVDQGSVVGGHPLLGDPEQRSEDSDQKSEDLLDHDLEVSRLSQAAGQVRQLPDEQLGKVDHRPPERQKDF